MLAIASTYLSAAAATVDYSPVPHGTEQQLWGNGVAETIDVAVRITDPGLAGMRIKGLRVPLATKQAISNISGWVSTYLSLSGKVNNPDCVKANGTWDAAPDANGRPCFTVHFPYDYTLTAEGVYVGYTVSVDQVDSEEQRKPIVLSTMQRPRGFYVHTSKTYSQWSDQSDKGLASPITVLLEGDAGECVAVPVAIEPVYVEKGHGGVAKVTVSNYGTQPINSLGYSYSLDNGEPITGTYQLSRPIAAQFGTQAVVELPLTMEADCNRYSMTLRLTEVNGQANVQANKELQTTATLVAFTPTMRPLMEEYTGTWCGWCPRGYIAMERLNHELGSRFIGIAYHVNDQMHTLRNFPTPPDGYPSAVLNRSHNHIDPYYGSSGVVDMGIRQDWERLAAAMPAADLDVAVEWLDANRLKAVAKVRFIFNNHDEDYRVSFALIGNKLSNKSWYQSNSYAGNSKMRGEDWEVFTRGYGYVQGLEYNDVALEYAFRASPGSLPATIEAGEEIVVEHTFDISGIRNIYGDKIINRTDALQVVGVITRGDSGLYVNAAKSAQAGDKVTSLPPAPEAYGEIIGMEYHDLQGRRLPAPLPSGAYIRTILYSSGHRQSVKQM